jgi:hypothetical protein
MRRPCSSRIFFKTSSLKGFCLLFGANPFFTGGKGFSVGTALTSGANRANEMGV